MEIIEYTCVGKRGQEILCEDGIFISSRYIAVIDGVTDKTGCQIHGFSPGVFAKKALLQALYTMPSCNALQCAAYLQNALACACTQEELQNAKPQAVCILYSVEHQEIWAMGDCLCQIDGKNFSFTKVIDDVFAQIRADVLWHYLYIGKQNLQHVDIGRERILPLLCLQHKLANQNTQLSYTVLNGMDNIKPTVIPVQKGQSIVLASDGYPKLFGSLAQSEDYLQKVLQTDPLCMYSNLQCKALNPNWQSFDDRSYIRFIA
ncbi:MAG: hypothetical protein SPL05_04190 [Eubacteriales bacterium]|nr:hypothetical protein [Eubacteriales bacterium]